MRRFWATLALPLLVSCNGSPTDPPPSAGVATLLAAHTSAQMSLVAMTRERQHSHHYSDETSWMSSQPTAWFDEGRVTAQGEDGEASAEATLSCWSSLGTADGVAVGSRFEIDALGRASGASRSAALFSARVMIAFDVASDAMYYELLFAPGSEQNLADRWSLYIRLFGPGGTVIDERQTGAQLGNRTLIGTLPPGRYNFAFAIECSSNWEQHTAPATGNARLWFAVKK